MLATIILAALSGKQFFLVLGVITLALVFWFGVMKMNMTTTEVDRVLAVPPDEQEVILHPAAIFYDPLMQTDEEGLDSRLLSFGNAVDDLAHKFIMGYSKRKAGLPTVTPMGTIRKADWLKDQAKRCLEWRIKRVGELRAQGNTTFFVETAADGTEVTRTYGDAADVAEELYKTNPHTGELLDHYYEPVEGEDLVAVTANRRTSIWPFAVLAYRVHHNDTKAIFSIPVLLRKDLSHSEVIEIQTEENDREGQRNYDDREYAIQIRRLLHNGEIATQADAGNKLHGMKYGTLQKAWPVAVLDNKYPGLKLIRRCMEEKPKLNGKTIENPAYTPGGWVNWGALNKEELRTLVWPRKGTGKKGFEPNKEVVQHVYNGNFNHGPATEAEVEAYLKWTLSPEHNAAKVMDKGKFAGIVDSTSEQIMKDIFNAVLADDLKAIQQDITPKIAELRTKASNLELAQMRITELEGQVADLTKQRDTLQTELDECHKEHEKAGRSRKSK